MAHCGREPPAPLPTAPKRGAGGPCYTCPRKEPSRSARHMMLRVVLLCTSLWLSCAPPAIGDCGPKNCGGCCDAQGQCRAGTATSACGSSGFSCLACGQGQRCGATSACERDPNAPQGGGTAGAGGGSPGGGGPATVEQQYVNAHNAARRRATPAPNPPLPDVTWDAAAADFAKAGADSCVFSHRQQNQYGENLFAATTETSPTEIVDAWDSEKAFYTYATGACTQVCGHYTQVVWRSSVRLGCATRRCTVNSPFNAGTWFLTACNYAPPGNVVGQKPY